MPNWGTLTGLASGPDLEGDRDLNANPHSPSPGFPGSVSRGKDGGSSRGNEPRLARHQDVEGFRLGAAGRIDHDLRDHVALAPLLHRVATQDPLGHPLQLVRHENPREI